MTRNETRPDETVVSHENVVVSREFTTKDEGIVVTLRLRSTDEQPATVHVTDEFPAALPIEAVCFNPEKGPNSGDITPQRASIEQPLDDEPVEVEYGISLSESVEEVQLGPPTIREVATGITRGASRQTDDGARSSTIESWDFGPSKSFSSLIPSLGSGSSEPDDSDAMESADGTSNTNLEPPETDGGGPGENPPEPEGGALDDASPESIEEAVERVNVEDDTDSSSVEASEHVGTEEDGPEAENDETVEVALEEKRGDTSELGGDTESASEETIEAALEDGPYDTSEPENRTEAEDDSESTGDERSPETRRSLELRIDHLSARIEEFAAYTAGLEELLDDHGTASTFIDRMEEELATLDEGLQSTRDDVDAVRENHDEDVSDLRERTDRLDERLDGVREDFETGLEDVHDRVETVEDDVQALREEVGELRAEVAELENLRESLADALTPSASTEGSVDD
ncbi:hypothetical protein [Natronomonas amylolytica]|uniref:hypothetical protein n=1 Tax=Natronomonas amylolytica TaxID=3108498 RepID=UPI00300A47B1